MFIKRVDVHINRVISHGKTSTLLAQALLTGEVVKA